MDTNEMIALGIVAAAVYLAVRYFICKKGGGCCGSDCMPKFEKKGSVPKPEDKKQL